MDMDERKTMLKKSFNVQNMRKLHNTIFLDRDGVINIERPDDYVKNYDEFEFCDGALEALEIIAHRFENIFIVTNQRGVGRNIMTLSDLEDIHKQMLSEIKLNGGRIDKIFFCTDLSNDSINRKPNTGMAFQAKEQFENVAFENSILVGNSKSDIYFGDKLDMTTVLVGDKYSKDETIYDIADFNYQNLLIFAKQFK